MERHELRRSYDILRLLIGIALLHFGEGLLWGALGGRRQTDAQSIHHNTHFES